MLRSTTVHLAVIATAMVLMASGGAKSSDRGSAAGDDALVLNPAAWRDDSLTLSNLGHATLLINFYGMRVITDPSLFEGVGVSMGGLFTIGPHRYNPPPLSPEQIPAPDVILITHAHMDHLDIPSLRALPKSAVVIACDRCGDLIAPLGFSEVRELKWGESTTVSGLTVTAMGARHWGRRWPPLGKDRGFNSYVLDKGGHRMLVGCDSALTEVFTPLRANPPEVAAFSIGAYDPWIWNHANPEQVWTMFQQTGAQWLVPIHWGTFKLSREPMDEPLARLNAAAGAERDRIVLQQIGGTWTIPARAQSAAAAGR